VRVEGLETLDYLDNLCEKERFTEQGDALTFESEVILFSFFFFLFSFFFFLFSFFFLFLFLCPFKWVELWKFYPPGSC
jgi:hypothetical protein